MILRRIIRHLGTQNWTAIGIDFVILVVGVFLGTEVSNWNQSRIQRRDTQRLLTQIVPELQNQIGFFDSAKAYYATTRRYAQQALAGWAGDPEITDEQFVIAAYQASQILGVRSNAHNWALVFGADQLRNLEDANVRQQLAVVMSENYDAVDFRHVETPYREHVREVIPADIQDRIRTRCGDHDIGLYYTTLPATCDLNLTSMEWRSAAAALRSRRELIGEINWHLAAIATYVQNLNGLEIPLLQLRSTLRHQ